MSTARCTTFDVASPKTASKKLDIEDINSLEILRLWEEHQLLCIEVQVRFFIREAGLPPYFEIFIRLSRMLLSSLTQVDKMSSNPLTLQFGIEMEFLLKPKTAMKQFLEKHKFDDRVTTDSKDEKAKDANCDALRNALVDILASADIEAGTSIGTYDKWIVADERSLDERTGYCKSTMRL